MKKDWSKEPYPGLQPCANCNRPIFEHYPANYADGPLVGRRLEVCPTAVFQAKPDDTMPEFLA